MNNFFYIILFFILPSKIYHEMASCFQLKPTSLLNTNEYLLKMQRPKNIRSIITLENSFSSYRNSLKPLNTKKNVYEYIEKYITNTSYPCNKSKNKIKNDLDKFISNFTSNINAWDEITIHDVNTKDITSLINILGTKYKKAYIDVGEKKKKLSDIYNLKEIKSFFLSLESISIENINANDFFKHLEIYTMLLTYCKDNYVSFSFIKNEIVNSMDKIIKYSQNYLYDEYICNKMKSEFINIYDLIKKIKKNDSIKINIINFLYILSNDEILNNNSIFYFLTEIFSSLNLLMKDSPHLVHFYEYIINPEFFFLCIFSLYTYNISKSRFYYFMLLIHNQIYPTNKKEGDAKYDSNLNYNVYREYVINNIFEKEKIEYESIKNVIEYENTTNIEKQNDTNTQDINSNEKKESIVNNKTYILVKKNENNIQFKELYNNLFVQLLLFYVFFYFSDYYFCVIFLLRFKHILKDKEQCDKNLQILNYMLFILLHNLYNIRDYFKVIIVLDLFKNNFSSFSDHHLAYAKKITNSVINNVAEDTSFHNTHKLLLEINEQIKNIEIERKIVNTNDTSILFTKNNVRSNGNEKKKKIDKCDSEHAQQENEDTFFLKHLKSQDINTSDLIIMREKFNNYLVHLLKNKEHDKIEKLEKRDNLYANNKTYSLFIKSFLYNHKYDKVYKVYKTMKLRKSMPIKYLNVKNLIESFKKCDVDKGDVLNELNLISKYYLNLYFSKDSYFVLTKTLLYKHMCDYLKKKCDMKLMIDIFNINELLKYFIKFKSFINIKKLYFLLLNHSYIKTYKTYLILIRFFNNLNYENEKVNEQDGIKMEENAINEDEEIEKNKIENTMFEKNTIIYNDIINLRKNELFYYICKSKDLKNNLDLCHKIYDIAKKDKYEMSLFVLSNFITEYVLFDYPLLYNILENEYSNINNILNIFFESINLFFYKQNYRIALNISFLLLLYLNYYVTKYVKNDFKYSMFLKKNILNFFIGNNYGIIQINKDEIYSYIPNFILNIISMCINHIKNSTNIKEIMSSYMYYSYDFNKNLIESVNYKNIMCIFSLLKNNIILYNGTMEKDIFDKKLNNKRVSMPNEEAIEKKRSYLYNDVIEKKYNKEHWIRDENESYSNSSNNINNVANLFVKLKYTVGTNKTDNDSLKDFLFTKLKNSVTNKNIDLLINILKDIFFTYKSIIYLNSKDFLNIYEILNGIYDNVLSIITIIFFMENINNFTENEYVFNTSKQQLHEGENTNKININEFISMLKSENKQYFENILTQGFFIKYLKNYQNFIYMCIYYDLNKKKVKNIMRFLEMLRKCNITPNTEILMDVFSLYFDKKMNNQIFKEFEILSPSNITNFEIYYIVMKTAFFEDNVTIAMKVFDTVVNSFNLKTIPLNFFECILLILKKSNKHKDLYEAIDKLHRELIRFEKNKQFNSIQDLIVDIKNIINKQKNEKPF
ncbi:conserved Plasmodium protein, unknown function [Plasmodium berghei]|uniref:Uncharacterized protein n=2 Tax=Plasmodium berghei TaxID=5821 RepID=A0A509AHK4_PLABA|nr:conserved Plasmodium protein, unknown function [Plasmodium berghei ANKA]CXI26023.1 conserved Plasmodium protein, unknown function [Plasmodium berghei]SCM20461.1 conserved Plasmodium protein, unknown function [Plasmodium berghei]SCN24051.1 conserved Plasmodium protein, unknown function [Plasmodium berghei]SCO59369.1 conserved Plasmodium protein, unknown function [Plasmodium berghei]SCO60512.1 conserved Plasmodium protein, unknown function [Plasmodium berghei]|eukprot:XP_034420906.1 conserved Plasmodium protein, unknown function [Plasmodium berghei ANKA]